MLGFNDLNDFEKFFSEQLKKDDPLTTSLNVKELANEFIACYHNLMGAKAPYLNKSLVFLTTAGNDFRLPAHFRNILQENAENFMNEEGMKDFIGVMQSSRVNVNVKIDLLHRILFHPELSKVPNYNDPIIILLDILEPPQDWLSQSELINAIEKDQRFSEELKDAARVINLVYTFNKSPEKGIELLTEDRFSNLLKEASFNDLVIAMGTYLNNASKPMASKVKLFCTTFEKLCTDIDPDTRKYDDALLSYLKFIISNWEQREVKNILNYPYPLSFLGRHISKIPVNIWESFPERLIQKIFEDEQALKQNGLWNKEIINTLTIVSLKRKNSKDKEKKFKTILPLLFEQNFDKFSKMIILESKSDTPANVPSRDSVLDNIISNQDGYDEGVTFFENYQKGTPLTLKDGTPIGYNVHLPKGEVRGVYVQVYGGFQIKDRKEKLSHPGSLGDVDLELLNKGYAVVTLNLVNLLKLDVYQFEMPKDLHATLQESIHQFYLTLKDQPQILDPALDVLKDKPIFLYGASFGGRTAIKHAELYPGTFDGYISFDGGISNEMAIKSDSPLVAGEFRFSSAGASKAALWLDAANGIDAIRDPVLLLHNSNDNNVNLMVTLDWYKKAMQARKQNLIRLHITEKGNPVDKDIVNTGHFPTKEEIGFKDMLDAMVSFMENGPPGIPAIHDWKAYRYNILANKYYQSATLEERFVSEAYRLYQADNQFKTVKLSEQNWETHYKPLYYTLHYIDTMVNPIYEMDKIENLLTPEMIEKGLQLHLSSFLTFIQEKENLKLDIDIKKIASDPALQKEYVQAFKDNEKTLRYWVSSLYKANPELLKAQFTLSGKDYDKDPVVQNALQKAHTKLNKKIEKEEERRLKIWPQLITAVRDRKMLWHQKISQNLAEKSPTEVPSSKDEEVVKKTPKT